MKNHEFISTLAHEFELSFLATGLTPVARQFGDGATNGCLVTALDVSEHGNTVPATFWEALTHDEERVERARRHLQTKFGRADEVWWGTFVRYLILSYDHRATTPRQWTKRTADEEFTPAVSPKLLAAAVGGLLRYRLLLVEAVEEKAPTPAPRRSPKRRERAAAVAV